MLVRCPNCDAMMQDSGKCPCCGHWDDVDCDCRWCLTRENDP